MAVTTYINLFSKTCCVKDYIKLLRPHHWIKNLLVFTGIFFAGNFFQPELLTVIIMFLVFCLASSFIYVANDIKDYELDKLHPQKKKRPISSGKVSVKQAKTLLGIIFVIILLMNVFLIPLMGSIILSSYLILNLLYVFLLKKIVILDIFSISLGYILRVLAGTVPINLDTSLWLLITVLSLSLFLAVTKRSHEMKHSRHKQVLNYYSKDLLNDLGKISITLSLVFYTTYVVMEKNNYLSFAGLFIVYLGIFRYLLLYQNSDNAHDPIKLFFKDKWLIIIFAIWALMQFLGLYMMV